ncbi:MAG: helix-turn-helix domain-containing protein [Candidatus Paceibacterota bacterium]|jgi:ATP-dependent exoDNAse (exonuclease V) alpha subunit
MTQAEALNILKSGANVYLTGNAGSGKTYVLNQYIGYLKAHGVEVAVTASTGIAATHMNGITIHSWSGLGIRDSLSDWDLEVLQEKQNLFKRFEKTKVLIIDEVSMLHARQLDMIDRIARAFKRSDKPFGGMQVVLSGDFFQLPPITRDASEVCFVDQSNAWKCMDIKICYLEEQHRQEKGGIFTKILNEIRSANVSEETMQHFRSRYRKAPEGSVMPTKLYTHNADVDALNNRELEKLPGDMEVYEMTSRGKGNLVENLKKSCLAPETLRLKEGAAVMFVKNNFEKGYANGTLGTVIGFDDSDASLPIVKLKDGREITVSSESWAVEEDGKVKAEIDQIPLRLAWAITVHKSQGMSLDAAEIDLSKSFVAGQGYVALSRLRSLEGLCLMGLNKTALEVDARILDLDQELKNRSEEIMEVFENLDEKGLKLMHDTFVVQSGGTLDVEEIKRNKNFDKKVVIRGSTYEETRKLVEEKKSLIEMAKERDMTEGTIITHLEKLKEMHPELDLSYLALDKKILKEISDAFKKSKDTKLSPVYSLLKGKYDFDELRIARMFLKE